MNKKDGQNEALHNKMEHWSLSEYYTSNTHLLLCFKYLSNQLKLGTYGSISELNRFGCDNSPNKLN